MLALLAIVVCVFWLAAVVLTVGLCRSAAAPRRAGPRIESRRA